MAEERPGNSIKTGRGRGRERDVLTWERTGISWLGRKDEGAAVGGRAAEWIGTNTLVLIASYQPNWDAGSEKLSNHPSSERTRTPSLLSSNG